ncbi:MAG: PD40 domain-containing protein [Candidatus Krumholzibacteriota bacterium]|nr:PD40 domain-containing protein [Candidatus Krumholzibacteriota bacterium]
MMLRQRCGSLTVLAMVLLIFFTKDGSGQTDIHLSTEKPGSGTIPIVVSDFETDISASAGIAAYISRVLEKDLLYTGVFDPVRYEAGSDTLAEGRTASAIVEGSLSKNEAMYTLEARLLDFSSREVIFSKRYSFKSDAKRSIAHHLCDEILFFLAGETGIATTRILFTRKEGEFKNLYMIDYDGFGERRVTKDELVVSPEWIDHDRFCFTSYRRDNPDCYLFDPVKNTRTNISHRKGINVAGSYFAPRDELAMTLSLKGNSEIYLIRSSGEVVTRVTNNRAIDCSPSWSPNGGEIAFVSDRRMSPQIYVMDRYGGNTRRLTHRGSYNTSPAWSPRGDMIVFVSRESWLYRLRLISPDGLMEEDLFDDMYSYEDPCWAPDGRHLATTVQFAGVPWIVVVDVESGSKRRLVQGESSSWSPLKE